MSNRLLALLLSLLCAPPVLAALPQQAVLIQADAAWLSNGERIAPAYVLIQDGEVMAVSSRAPMSRTQKIEVHGTLAIGLVDAWGGPLPSDLLRNRHRPGGLAVSDSLPVDLAGADPALAARVASARRNGIAAAYLAPGGGVVRRGLGTSVGFSTHDLPVAVGEAMLDLAAGSALGIGLGAQKSTRDLVKLFEGGDAFRDQQDEYAEKLEKYEKDLEDYQKKLEEYKKKKDEAEKKAGAAAAGKNGGNGKNGKNGGKGKNGEKGKNGDKKPEPPKRPQRPKEPVADAGMERILQALAGSLKVRIEANSVADLRQILELKQRFELDLVIVGGQEADLVAEELAEAGIPVVLPALAEHGDRPDPERSLAVRFGALTEAGVDVALASGRGDGSQALLLLRAGELVAAGADPDQVWDALTRVPAEILGLEGQRGTLVTGAAADLLLFEGSSPFDASAPMRVYSAQSGFDQ